MCFSSKKIIITSLVKSDAAFMIATALLILLKKHMKRRNENRAKTSKQYPRASSPY